MREALRLTKARADAQRLRILTMLDAGELCVCQIVEVLMRAPSTVCKHLSILSGTALVEGRKEGRWAYHWLVESSSAGAQLLRWKMHTLRKDPLFARDWKQLKAIAGGHLEDICRKQRQRGAATAGSPVPFQRPARRAS